MTEPRVLRVLAPNPGPFTLEGTNTWVVGEFPALVIDPGPDDTRHLEGLLERAGKIGAVLVTHHHADHASGAGRLARLAGVPVMAASPRAGEQRLEDGALIEGGGVTLRVLSAPGHTSDHVVFFEQRTGALFTGDAVLGRGTSVIDPPDGDVADYVRSLERMAALHPAVIYPGHGPTVRPAVPKLQEYLEHRRERERQVIHALGDGPLTPEEIVPDIYGDHPVELYPAAARSVLAHLLKLEREGVVARVTAGAQRFVLTAAPSAHGRSSPPDAGEAATST